MSADIAQGPAELLLRRHPEPALVLPVEEHVAVLAVLEADADRRIVEDRLQPGFALAQLCAQAAAACAEQGREPVKEFPKQRGHESASVRPPADQPLDGLARTACEGGG
jgi:hypothetical protein